MPFRRTVGYWAQIVVGRWLGGLLGYKPFYREYTTDWDYAVAKMKSSFFQRNLVNEAYKHEMSWEGQTELGARPKPTNAGFEPLTVDLHQSSYGVDVPVNGVANSAKGRADSLMGVTKRANGTASS
jgi:hypothetical protein